MAVIRRTTTAPLWYNASDRNYIVDTINYLRSLYPNSPASVDAINRFKTCINISGNHYHQAYDQMNDQGEARWTNTGAANTYI